MLRDKSTLTEKLVHLLPEQEKIDYQQAMNIWWFNLRKRGGMRLTATGYHALAKTLELEHFEYHIQDPTLFNQHTVLNLDKKMQMPYYIHAVKGIPKTLVLFGSREAVMVNLYGDLKRFLDNYNI